MNRPWLILIILAFSLALGSACSAGPAAPSATSPTSGPTAVSPSASPFASSPAASPAPSTSPTNESSAQKNPPILFPESAGLDRLESYNLSLRISFKGTLDGQTLDTVDLYTRTLSLNPSAQFTTIQTSDDNGKPTTLIRGWVGNILYVRAGLEEPCRARTTSSVDRQTFNPAVLLKPIQNGKELARETVNTVPARHYVMDTLQASNTQISGEVWIADPGAFVVKYAMSVKGGDEYFGKGNQGERTTVFELRDVGAKMNVSVPAGCLPPVTDLPVMPDAANVKRSLTTLSYTTASGAAKTVAFYQDQMKALGWALESAQMVPVQQPAGGPSIPNLSQLPKVPGVNLGQYLPTAFPTTAAPALQNGWLIFQRTKEQRSVYFTLQPEGANWRVKAEIVQE